MSSSAFEELCRAVGRRDGPAASRLIKAGVREHAGEHARAPPRDARGALARAGGLADDCLAAHAGALAALRGAGGAGAAYAGECAALAACMRAWRERGEADADAACLNSMLWALAANLRALASAADRELVRRGGAPSRLSDAANVLRGAFAEAMKGGSPPRRRAALEFLNQLFCVYFRLNTLGQCKHLMRTVQQPNFPPFAGFPASHRVTYSYYAGRLSVFHDDFDAARRHLSYALEHAHRGAGGNRRRILQYLVPVRMLSGSLPSSGLLEQHGLVREFAGAAAAIRTGDLEGFDAALRDNFDGFVRAGTYLLMEKMRSLVHRALLRRVHAIRGGHHQVHLRDFLTCLRMSNEGATMDEAECIVANLIYRKYVKGYISHAKRVLVVSKQRPFPLLGEVPVPVD